MRSDAVTKSVIAYVQCTASGQADCKPGERFSGVVHIVNGLNEVNVQKVCILCVMVRTYEGTKNIHSQVKYFERFGL